MTAAPPPPPPPGPPPGEPVPPEVETDAWSQPPGQAPVHPLAVASLVLGIFSIILVPMAVVCCALGVLPSLLLGPAAAVCGHMVRVKMKHEPGIGGGGLALAGLICGYAGTALALVSLLAGGLLFAWAMQQNSQAPPPMFTAPSSTP